jgi:N-acetylated-alpha-linked acidic dipeptidase
MRRLGALASHFEEAGSLYVLYISWDGHEADLVGSGPWVQNNLPWLLNRTVAYPEVVSAVYGDQYYDKSSPLLAPLMRNITGQIQSPNKTIENEKVLGPEGGGDAIKFVSDY